MDVVEPDAKISEVTELLLDSLQPTGAIPEIVDEALLERVEAGAVGGHGHRAAPPVPAAPGRALRAEDGRATKG